MPLIKNSSSSRLISSACVLDLGDLDRQAKEIIDRAKQQAQQIVDDAQQTAAAMIERADSVGHAQGLERGLAEGRSQGLREGREQVIAELKPQLQQIIESWTAALGAFETRREEMHLSAREDVLAFAVAMGEKVIYRTIEVDDTIVQDQLAEALSLLGKPSTLAVRIHPDDRALTEQVLPELLQHIEQCQHVTIRDDAAMTRGGCVLSTAGGEVDARIETQLERIVEAILPWTTEQPPESPPAGIHDGSGEDSLPGPQSP